MSLATLLNTDATRNFLQDGDVYDTLVEIAEKYTLPEDRVTEILDLTDAVLDDQLPLAEVPAMLGEAFGTSEEVSRALAVEIAGIRLLPLETFFPGVSEQIKAWGGDVAVFNSFRVQKEGIRIEDLAQKVAQKAGVSFSDLLMKRLEFLLEQRINEQKTDESLRTFFGRPLTIGGMGLAKEQIDALMSAVTESIAGVGILGDEEKKAATDSEMDVTDSETDTTDQEATSTDSNKNGETPFMASPSQAASQDQVVKTDETENNPITALEIPPSHEVAAEVPVISSPDRQAESTPVTPSIPSIPPPPVAQPTTQNVAVPASAPVRSAPSVMSDEMPDVQAKKKAEKAKKMQSDDVKTAFSQAIDTALEGAGASLQETGVPLPAFADVVGKMLRGVRDEYQTRDVLEREYKVKGSALAQIMQVLVEVQETYRNTTALLISLEEGGGTLSEQEAVKIEDQEALRIDAKFTELTKNSNKPSPAKVELTVGSVAPAVGESAQKKVTDVVAGKRLMGPVEQLETLTLADFRRLSTNPEEAVRKMGALLTSLEKISYEERVRGVLAWRKSPLAALSVALIAESLNTGVAVAEITARRRSQGMETLGPAEMQALSKWNELVRF